MFGLYSQRSTCLSCQVQLSVCPVICPCIALTFTPALVGGDVKAYFIIAQLNLARDLGLPGILGFAILFPYGVINL